MIALVTAVFAARRTPRHPRPTPHPRAPATRKRVGVGGFKTSGWEAASSPASPTRTPRGVQILSRRQLVDDEGAVRPLRPPRARRGYVALVWVLSGPRLLGHQLAPVDRGCRPRRPSLARCAEPHPTRLAQSCCPATVCGSRSSASSSSRRGLVGPLGELVGCLPRSTSVAVLAAAGLQRRHVQGDRSSAAWSTLMGGTR